MAIYESSVHLRVLRVPRRRPTGREPSLPRTLKRPPPPSSRVRAIPLVLLLLAASLAPPSASSDAPLRSPCNDWVPGGPEVVDRTCKRIHPGALMANGCTLAWIVTDGTDLYAATAGHCVGALGEPLSLAGDATSHGSVVFKGVNDSAFFRIAPASHGLVDGAMRQWGGQTLAVTGVAHRNPLPGEPLLHYGWGAYTKNDPELRGRPSVALAAVPGTQYTDFALVFFASPGLSGGDSGSPIMTATGEAVGIVSAAVFPVGLACGATGVCPVDAPGQVGVAVSMHTEMKHFSRTLKKPITLVTGEPILSV